MVVLREAILLLNKIGFCCTEVGSQGTASSQAAVSHPQTPLTTYQSYGVCQPLDIEVNFGKLGTHGGASVLNHTLHFPLLSVAPF
jgi:hypothetical protein